MLLKKRMLLKKPECDWTSPPMISKPVTSCFKLHRIGPNSNEMNMRLDALRNGTPSPLVRFIMSAGLTRTVWVGSLSQSFGCYIFYMLDPWKIAHLLIYWSYRHELFGSCAWSRPDSSVCTLHETTLIQHYTLCMHPFESHTTHFTGYTLCLNPLLLSTIRFACSRSN